MGAGEVKRLVVATGGDQVRTYASVSMHVLALNNGKPRLVEKGVRRRPNYDPERHLVKQGNHFLKDIRAEVVSKVDER